MDPEVKQIWLPNGGLGFLELSRKYILNILEFYDNICGCSKWKTTYLINIPQMALFAKIVF